MSLVTSILTAGTNNHQTTSEEANRFLTNFTTPGVVGGFTAPSGSVLATGAFAVQPQATPDKTVSINAIGDIVVATTPAGQALQNLTTRGNAAITKTIADNTTGAVRYDYIYVVHDATRANNPAVNGDDVASIVVNRSTLNTSDTIGAPANSELIGMVTVANGFTSITNANITDLRRAAGAAIPNGSVNAPKISLAVGSNLIKPTGGNFTSTTPVDVAGTAIVVNVPVGASTVWVTGGVTAQTQTGGTIDVFVRVVMDNNVSAQGVVPHFTAVGIYNGGTIAVHDIFSNVTPGNHTFKLQAWSSTGTVNIGTPASGSLVSVIPLAS